MSNALLLTTAAPARCRCPGGGEGDRGPAAGEDPIVGREVADEVEMRGKARVGQHTPCIATNRKHPPTLDEMMAVQLKGIRPLRHSASIDDRLAVVLAGRLQSVELEQAKSG